MSPSSSSSFPLPMIVFVLIGFVITIHLSAISRAREAQRMTDGGPWPQPRCGACCPPPQDCQREDSCRSGQSNPALWPHLHLHQHLHVRGSLRTLQLCSGLAGQYKALHCPPPSSTCSMQQTTLPPKEPTIPHTMECPWYQHIPQPPCSPGLAVRYSAVCTVSPPDTCILPNHPTAPLRPCGAVQGIALSTSLEHLQLQRPVNRWTPASCSSNPAPSASRPACLPTRPACHQTCLPIHPHATRTPTNGALVV